MSADNGVYVLVSRGRKTHDGHEQEYRVVHAQAIENVFSLPDYPDETQDSKLNRHSTLMYFRQARVINDRKIAEGYAQAIHDQWMKESGFVEHGIVWFDDFAGIPFPDGRPEPRRHQHRHLRSVPTG